MTTSTNPGVRVRMEAFARNKELYGENAAKFIGEMARIQVLTQAVVKRMPQEPTSALVVSTAATQLSAIIAIHVACSFEIPSDEVISYSELACRLAKDITKACESDEPLQ